MKKYTLDLLKSFCHEHNLVLREEYSIKTNSLTFIYDTCINPGCENIFKKKFHILYNTLIFTCKECTQINNIKKGKETLMAKYGVDNAFKIDSVKQKIQNIWDEKYNGNPLKCNFIRDKIKNTNIIKYGYSFPMKNISIMLKSKITRQINFMKAKNIPITNINTNPLSLIAQRKLQNLELFGCEKLNKKQINEKIKLTLLKKYNVTHVSKLKFVLEKKKENCFKKYGVYYTTQVATIQSKILRSMFTYKLYTFPSGNTIKVQGYENFALNDLLNKYFIKEDDIVTGSTNVPVIWYKDIFFNDRRHFVDIFIPSQNKCIEIKSVFTLKKQNVFLKQEYAKKLGYLYEIWVYNQKGEIIQKYL